jgi:hypothetical protein
MSGGVGRAISDGGPYPISPNCIPPSGIRAYREPGDRGEKPLALHRTLQVENSVSRHLDFVRRKQLGNDLALDQ